MTPQKMTPQTPSGRFCLKNGSLSTFPPPTGSHSKNENSGSGTTLTEQLLNFVHYDKLDIYAAGRLLAQESKKRDIWPEAESFIRKISGTVHEVVHVPRVFDYTNEETMYCIELKDLLKKYQEKPAVKILQMPAISTTILEKIGSMWNVCQQKKTINENILKVSDEWMHGFMTREKNAKKIVKSFMIHILMNITSPPENIKTFTIRTTRNTKSGYEELPADVTHELIRLAVEGLGLNRWELSDDASDYQLTSSSWFKCIGRNEAESRAIRSRMIEFKASSGPNFLEILKTCFPEIRRYENGRDHLDKVHHVKKERKRVHQEELNGFGDEDGGRSMKRYGKRAILEDVHSQGESSGVQESSSRRNLLPADNVFEDENSLLSYL
ncbi:hypothetical protein B9Z55_014598 [Caenorhabditis nigoni]|uniref:Uncharacterized protein n=3 Tax=Caenorhabditis nigoni TaxID=1611254 RepID=A0A2G5SM87_9PELO|nr:hypothetical protein B9Z55_029021 [Caenorhabditis nigoni]PIC16138.1 hypothetical protein B9Z55_022844 [Caenorhabditis nigoni]PIC22500.1 hypothetical protein B9Z55_016530 [Caenorhabditis nigoni]PIC24473.1 hypothetical protein B9Z55_017802 [Caenorhabditis nigoni]PIC29991.1 hypothetical protein B9Z55_021383 [Caenorhabditis nigoni]